MRMVRHRSPLFLPIKNAPVRAPPYSDNCELITFHLQLPVCEEGKLFLAQNDHYPGDSCDDCDETEEDHEGDEDHGSIRGWAASGVGSFDEEFGEGDHEEEETSEEELV